MLQNNKKICDIKGCQFDKAFAIINQKTNKIHRITFSRDLAFYILKLLNDKSFTVKAITFVLGKELKQNEISDSKLYAITNKNKWTLRISLFQEIANMFCDFKNQKIYECWITKIE